jgi:hypothetical protein
MKKGLALALGVVICGATGVLAQGPRDAVAVDPTHHHVVLENDHVRVWEALATPGASSPMHTHPPMVLVSLAKLRMSMRGPEGDPFIFDLNPAQVLWLEDLEHSWELLAGQAHVITVEPKAALSSEEAAPIVPGPRDAVAVDPTHHHVILENDHVRVFEVVAAPGATSPMHTHPPLVAVSLAKARLSMRGPDGAPFMFDINPGQVLWLEGVEHSWELLAGQVHLVAVEMKRSPRPTSEAE